MSTPYTVVRCGMRDLISCFNARKVLTKEDREESAHQKPKSSSNDEYRKHETRRQVELGTMIESSGGGQESPKSWKSCESEEDKYIVFYFKDDDARVDVVEERCLEISSCKKQDTTNNNRQKKPDIQEIQVDYSRIKEVSECEQHESHEHKDSLGESSDSSTSSFAFPRIQRKWTGSPVLMPRPEGHKKSPMSVCVQCCKI